MKAASIAAYLGIVFYLLNFFYRYFLSRPHVSGPTDLLKLTPMRLVKAG